MIVWASLPHHRSGDAGAAAAAAAAVRRAISFNCGCRLQLILARGQQFNITDATVE